VLGAALKELISLFVDDGTLAVGIVVWAAAAWWSAGRLPVDAIYQTLFFVAGFSALLAYSAVRAVRG
jgi:hypothetical protein